MFLVGAATGGVFFGWLGDRIGRVRAMALSIFTYAIFTGLCGFATEAWHIAALRFIASLGMGGEWSLGVALVNEIWPNKSRALIAGLIGAAANLGFLMVGLLSIGLHRFIGGVEALLLGIGMPTAMVEPPARELRMALPDDQRRAAGAAGVLHPAVRARIEEVGAREGARRDVALVERRSHRRVGGLPRIDRDHLELVAGGHGPGAAAIITVVGVAAALWGFLFPVRRYLDSRRLRRIARAAPAAHRSSGTCCLARASPAWRCSARGDRFSGRRAGHFSSSPTRRKFSREYTQICVGARRHRLPDHRGRGRRTDSAAASRTPRFAWDRSCRACCSTRATTGSTGSFCSRIFLAGGITAAFYGLFPLYLPELFPTVVRATGQGFAYNFGRILAAVGGLQTATLMGFFGGSFPMAGSVLTVFYAVGLVIIWLGPETMGKPLPE